MMAQLASLLVLLACGAAPLVGSRQLLEAAAARPVLRVGFGSEPRVPMSSLEDGQPKGFEGLLIQAMAERAGYDLEIVPLETLEERLAAVINGTVDASINSIIVTAQRSKLVQFLSPGYYSAGSVVFAPGGRIEGVSSWGDLSGRTLSVVEGGYTIDAAAQSLALQNVTLLPVPNIQEAAELVYAGEADGFLDDSSTLFPAANLTIVPELQPILRAPYSIAVRIGNDELAQNLTKALMSLVEGGPNSTILQMEKETFGAAGAPPNPDLAALVANPIPGSGLLYPIKESECWPVFPDSIWLPADAYEPAHTWTVSGVQNFSCNPTTGAYKFQGWLVNGTDFNTGKHAGYGYTAIGPSGTNVPTFVATDESNSTVLGVADILREVGGLVMPSPVDPATNAEWMRHPAYNQSGIFLTPKILYLSRTDTRGGLLPAGTGPCKEGDPVISMPITCLVMFYACRDDVL